jgi:1-phosphofructokinase
MIAVVSLNSCLDRILEVEGFRAGGVHVANLVAFHPAGKGMNVARLLATLGGRTALHGFVGRDALHRFEQVASGEQIACRLRALPIRTRINTTLLDPASGTETHIREQGDPVLPEELPALVEALQEDAGRGDWIVFAGSLPPGLRSSHFATLVRELTEAGRRVAVDIAGSALRKAAEAGAQLIKPNREELAACAGAPADRPLPEIASTLMEEVGVPLLLASDGEAGAWLFTPAGTWHAWVETPVRARNTVGAGDALLAGYLAAHAEDLPPEQCLRNAVETATAAVQALRAGELAVSSSGATICIKEFDTEGRRDD